MPQGTKLGPWLFILMIDDINTSNTELWKYVDDTTIAECVDKKEDSRIQSDVEEPIAKSNQNKFHWCREGFYPSAEHFARATMYGAFFSFRLGHFFIPSVCRLDIRRSLEFGLGNRLNPSFRFLNRRPCLFLCPKSLLFR